MAGRNCPTCRKSLDDSAAARAHLPFCSERCRSADLSRWLAGSYRITAPLSEEDLDGGLPAARPDDAGPDDPDTN